MNIEFDAAKDAENRVKHGVSLMTAVELDWNTAVATRDARFDYGEPREIAYALCGRRLYCVVFVRRSETLRIISLRKANNREIRRYEAQTGT